MQVTLEVTTGASAGTTLVVRTGQTRKVGRVELADLKILDDPLMSNVHFEITCEENACRVQDLGSRFGTKVNGKDVKESVVVHGDTIVAGRSAFAVRIERAAVTFVRTADAAPPPRQATPVRPAVAPPVVAVSRDQNLLKLLCAQPEPLFALLDAARDPKVLAVLQSANDEHQSLYEEKVETLAPFGPFLVRLSAESALLELLARQAWGKSWGLYLTSAQPFKDVRKHFRRFLLVKLEGGREVYFRFYDPRVLRTFLPTCTPQETAELFGPVSHFLIESSNPEMLLRFTNSPRGAKSTADYVHLAAK